MTSENPSRAADLIAAAADALKERRDEVDRLNVFPVPDGDTGTNMSLTMDAVLGELAGLSGDASRADICHAVTHGSLMGARGNSGVILSQVLRGLCEVFGRAPALDTAILAQALDHARAVAYQAVRRPVEGTMLTVVKDCAAEAKAAAAAGLPTDRALERVLDAAYDSVRRGPELLAVLKENGVVDAGGYGLAILAEGFVAASEGETLRRAGAMSAATASMSVTPVDDWADEEYLYCTEFLLHGEALDRDAIQGWVADSGGSELVVGDSALIKVHVHTDDPATVLARATALGQVSEVHVNNMKRQTAERAAALRSGGAPGKSVGVVAVAVGEGLAAILRSLGVDEVVSGGQTMNPSTQELLEAAERVDASSVILLPNNRNIIMAAQQVVGLASRPVAVVPTTSVPQAFTAMLEYDAEGELDALAAAMTDAAALVRSGEVTTAVKDATSKAGPIRTGQVIGISEREIEVVGDDVHDVAVRLAGILVSDGAETLTLLAGEDLPDDVLESIAAAVRSAAESVEVETRRGEQPLYPVLMSAE